MSDLPKGYSVPQTFLKTLKLVKEPIDVLMEGHDKFGDTFRFSVISGNDIIITRSPEFIDYILKKNHKNYPKSKILTEKLALYLGNGLLTSNGEYWLRQRRLIQPGFHKEKINTLFGIVKNVIDHYLKNFPVGNEIDVYPLMNKLAFEIVINSLFNVTLPVSTINELSRFISEVQSFVVKDIRQPYKNWWHVLTGQVKKNLRKAEQARELIRNIIHERKSSAKRYDDLLDMLLDARYEDSDKPMEENQMIDEIMILVVAGHETTANALSWTLYLLAHHQEYYEALRAKNTLDLDECLRDNFIASVMKESMRMYPPAWIMDRVSINDDSFDGHFIPARSIVTQFIYGLHHDPRYWQEPERFKPERFMGERADKVIGEAYYPFGGGPRFCIGSNFAMGEMAIFLQSFAAKFNIKPTHQVPIKMPLVTLRPDKVVLTISRC